ncbi:MAG: MFS transporter [Lentisphaeria bacterium]|nr:MFS transporter [Lentisphaeria bacterium]
MNQSEEKPRRNDALRLFIPLLLIYAASYFQRTALPGTIFNELQRDMSLDAVRVASVGAAFVYAYSLPQLAAGMFIDRYCGSRVVVFGGLVFVAGALWMPFCTSFPMLCLSRALTGLGASTMYLSLVKETDRLFGRQRYALMIGIAYFCGYGGGLCGKLPFAVLCQYFPWRQVMLGAGMLALVFYLAFLVAKAGVPMPPVPERKFSFAPLRHTLTNGYTWLVNFCAAVNFSVYFTIQTVFGEKFLMDFPKMKPTTAAGVTFAMTLVCMFVMLNTRTMFQFTGNRRRPLLIGAAGLCFVNSLLMTCGILFRLPGWFFVIVYLGFAVGAGAPPLFTMVMQELNSRDGLTQTTALGNMLGYLAVAVFAPVAGGVLRQIGGRMSDGVMIYSQTAYLTVFAAVTVIAALSLGAAFLLPETRGHYLRLHSE